MSGAGAAPFAPIAAAGPDPLVFVPRMAFGLDPVPADTEAAILRLVVRDYAACGNQLEAAVRMALRLGWAAGRAFPGETP